MATPMQTGLTQAQTQAAQAQQLIAINQNIRDGIIAVAQEVKQQIFSTTITNVANGNNVIRFQFRPVGLVKGFIVKVNFNIANASGGALVPTDWNLANVLSNVTLYDLDNYQRINTTGWHLDMLSSAKEGFLHGAAIKGAVTLNATGVAIPPTDDPIGYGNNFNALVLPMPATGANANGQMFYWVPCAYSARDLRGAIFAGVTNANAFLQLTLNSTPGVAAGDSTGAIYQNASVTMPSATVTVYQVYLDQLPKYQEGPNVGTPILPPLDISTQYRLNQTSLTGVTVNQDFPVPFSNFQQFLSLGMIYNRVGTLGNGTDLNSFKMAAANTYLPFNIDPITQAWLSRHKIKTDYPPGSYNFDFRNQPINTNQTGNMQLLINAATAPAGTNVLAAFESFALVDTILGAASLPAS